MARSKKKSTSQKIVGVATTGMPSPVRKLLSGKLIAALIVLIVPLLFATGVLSVEWQNGRPKFSLNRERASELRETTAEKVDELRDEFGNERKSSFGSGDGIFSEEVRQAESKFGRWQEQHNFNR